LGIISRKLANDRRGFFLRDLPDGEHFKEIGDLRARIHDLKTVEDAALLALVQSKKRRKKIPRREHEILDGIAKIFPGKLDDSAYRKIKTWLHERNPLVTEGNPAGVLVAGPNECFGYGRPVLISLGVDSSWFDVKIARDEDWLLPYRKDLRRERTARVESFLRAGEQHFVAVLDYRKNDDINPLKDLARLYEKNGKVPQTNAELPGESYRAVFENRRRGIALVGKLPKSRETDLFSWSKSSLDKFKTCPRAYYYEKIARIDQADTPQIDMGKLIHSLMEKKILEARGESEQIKEVEKDIKEHRLRLQLFSQKDQIPRIEARIRRFTGYMEKGLKDAALSLDKVHPEKEIKGETDKTVVRGILDIDEGLKAWDLKTGKYKDEASVISHLPLKRSVEKTAPWLDSQTIAYLWLMRLRELTARNGKDLPPSVFSMNFIYAGELEINPDADFITRVSPKEFPTAGDLRTKLTEPKRARGTFNKNDEDKEHADTIFGAMDEVSLAALAAETKEYVLRNIDKDKYEALLRGRGFRKEAASKIRATTDHHFSSRLLDEDVEFFAEYLDDIHEEAIKYEITGFSRKPLNGADTCSRCRYLSLCGSLGYGDVEEGEASARAAYENE